MLLMPAHGGPQARPAVSTGQNWKSNLLNSSRPKLNDALHFQLVQRLPVRTKQSLNQPHCSQLQLQGWRRCLHSVHLQPTNNK